MDKVHIYLYLLVSSCHGARAVSEAKLLTYSLPDDKSKLAGYPHYIHVFYRQVEPLCHSNHRRKAVLGGQAPRSSQQLITPAGRCLQLVLSASLRCSLLQGLLSISRLTNGVYYQPDFIHRLQSNDYFSQVKNCSLLKWQHLRFSQTG